MEDKREQLIRASKRARAKATPMSLNEHHEENVMGIMDKKRARKSSSKTTMPYTAAFGSAAKKPKKKENDNETTVDDDADYPSFNLHLSQV